MYDNISTLCITGRIYILFLQFDLICDKSWVTATIISLQMAGMSFGSVLVGPLSDQYGRRNPYMVGILLIFIGQAVAYFSVHWTMYAVAKFIIGKIWARYVKQI